MYVRTHITNLHIKNLRLFSITFDLEFGRESVNIRENSPQRIEWSKKTDSVTYNIYKK